MNTLTIDLLATTRTFTTAGFLLCRSVPISRVGDQIYLEQEISTGANGNSILAKDGVVIVTRDESEVFDDAAMLSFEGLPVTDDHPDGNVNKDNWRKHSVGHVQNVRKGDGAHVGCMVADMLICDADAIKAILDGKREISCGYNADYIQDSPGHARQVNIRGNHVALVDKGRCGPQCAIGDEAPIPKESIDMKLNWLDRVRRAFKANDEQLFEDALIMPNENQDDRHVVVNLNGLQAADSSSAPSGVAKDEPAESAMASVKTLAAEDKPVMDAAAISDVLTKMSAQLDAIETRIMAEIVEAKDDVKPEPVKDAEPIEVVPAEPTPIRSRGELTIVRTEWQDTLSRGEVLMPGIRLPTFDSAMTAQGVQEQLCGFRRKVVTAALETEHGHSAIAQYLGDSELKKLSCDAVKVLFMAASDKVKGANMRPVLGVNSPTQARGLPTTPAQIMEIMKAAREKM